MAIGIFEINDTGIQVAVGSELVATSPGYAVMDGDKLLIGDDGAKFARLLPRWTNNRFWNELSTDPMANARGQVRHHADLAFAHLESLWQMIEGRVDQAIFLVPGFYDREQLGLLLGMAKECGIPTAGVIDTSLATAAEQALRETVLHLDIHLHRITLTHLANTANLSRTDCRTVVETGIFRMWDRWANIVANQFVQTTRFDPLHDAHNEQALYNLLPNWIAGLGDARSATFDLDIDSISHAVAVSSEQLMTACAPVYPQIIQSIRNQVGGSQTATLLLSHRYRGFPGLRDSLDLLDNVEIIDLAADQPLRSAAAFADKIIGVGGVTHVINLPITTKKVVDDLVKHRRATHILHNHHAVAIGQSFKLAEDLTDGIHQDLDRPACIIYPRGGDVIVEVHGSCEVSVNGVKVDNQAHLQPGDVLGISGQSLTLISST